MDEAETDDPLSGIGTSYFTDLTHPPIKDFNHSDWSTFSGGLNTACESLFPQNPVQYINIHALLLNWADDDLGTDTELNDLNEQLKSQFKLTTEIWKIPNNDAENELEKKLSQVKGEHGGDGKLLIVYYGGHGVWDEKGSVWAANVKKHSPTLRWSGLQLMLIRAPYDVLIVLDCCYAGSAGREKLKGTKELLASCGMEVQAEGVSPYSFTRNLIHKLQSFGSQPFTVSELYERLLKAKKRLRNTPQYIPLSGRGTPSIRLVPLPRPIQSSPSIDKNPSAISSNAASIISPFDSYPRVLLAISLKDELTIPNLDAWTRWLSNETPHEILKIGVRVEHAFPSNSTSLLISMPIRVWCHLPDTTAYRFVDFITGERLATNNQIQEQLDLITHALALIQHFNAVPETSLTVSQNQEMSDEESKFRKDVEIKVVKVWRLRYLLLLVVGSLACCICVVAVITVARQSLEDGLTAGSYSLALATTCLAVLAVLSAFTNL